MITKDLIDVNGVLGKISVKYDDKKYEVHAKTVTTNAQTAAAGTTSNITIDRLLTYFKVTKANDPNIQINTFNPPLIFTIEYSANDWKTALVNNKNKKFKRPRVGYLARTGNNWTGQWVEFTGNAIKSFTTPAPGANSKGYLKIIVRQIPDPLIGGC